MNRTDYNNYMINATYTVGEYMRNSLDTYSEENLSKAFPDEVIKGAKRIFLTGCGDSYCCGVAARDAFETLTGIITDAPTAMEFSRYGYTQDMVDAILIGSSISGSGARLIEGTRRFNQYGGHSVAMTYNADSGLAQECTALYHMLSPARTNVGPSPKVAPYAASVIGLMMAAIYIGYKRGNYDAAQMDKYKSSLIKLVTDDIESQIERIADESFAYAVKWKDMTKFEFLSAGSNFGNAQFGAFKMVESCGAFASWDDLENWNHVNFLCTNPETIPTVVNVPSSSPFLNRALETIQFVRSVTRPTLVVTDGDDFDGFDDVIKMPYSEYGMFAPAIEYIPATFISAYIYEMNDDRFTPYRAQAGLWNDPGVGSIRLSKIEIV